MAEFTSKYSELTFFVNGKPQSFRGGRFVTDCKDCLSVLEKLDDAVRVDVEEAKTEEKPKAARKPARKTSEK